MRFNNERPIFAQIAEFLAGEIMGGRLAPGDRIPSARELAASLEVNPNTAARSLQALADSGLARCERGTGYYVDSGAVTKARESRRERFFGEELPGLFALMTELGIGFEEIRSRHETWRKENGK
jgi:GntR family transcriptional regulator